MLQRSLVHEVLIALDLTERPEAVVRPLDLLVQRPDRADRLLPPGTRLVDVFDDVDRALLILGAPGAGKTNAVAPARPVTCCSVRPRTRSSRSRWSFRCRPGPRGGAH